MVKLLLTAILITYSSVAKAGAGGFPKLRGFHITSIEVTKSGQWRPDPRYPNGQYPGQTRAECAKAKVSPIRMKRWFSHAVQLSHPVWMERTEWTQCYSDGVLISNGRKYYWFLDPSGRGNISTQPEQRGTVVYLAGPSILESGAFGLDGLDPKQ